MDGSAARSATHPVRAQVDFQEGFTLVELLIVILIIALLAGMVMATMTVVRGRAKEAKTSFDINAFTQAVEQFRQDEGYYPGVREKWDGLDENFNAFPMLFEGLFGDPPPDGKGGRNAPYWDEVDAESIVVLEDPDDLYNDRGEVEAAVGQIATNSQRYDEDISKFYMDPWGRVYFYRENESKKREDWMHVPGKFDLWSVGPNGFNQSLWEIDPNQERDADGHKYDDIGNWNRS